MNNATIRRVPKGGCALLYLHQTVFLQCVLVGCYSTRTQTVYDNSLDVICFLFLHSIQNAAHHW